MIVRCQNCETDYAVKCPFCGRTDAEPEPHSRVLDFCLSIIGQQDTRIGEIYVCQPCDRSFSKREGGVSHGLCPGCYSEAIHKIIDFEGVRRNDG